MEAKKAGIAYSDNLLTSELDEDENYTFPSITPQQNDADDNFEINTDVFNKIRAERNAARQRLVQMRFLPIHRLLKSRNMFP